MTFLVDKYPTIRQLDSLPKNLENLQHLLVVGGPSSGKEEFVSDLLHRLYGDGSKNIKETEYTINNYGSNSTKVILKHSNYHIILSPNNSALDKYIIQEVVVDFCKKNDLYFFKGKTPFKCVVVFKADNLSEQAQFCLRRVMESTAALCRFILVSSNPCNFIDPIRSRFVQVNIPTPSMDRIKEFVRDVATKESIVLEDHMLGKCIIRDSREALWRLESLKYGVPYNCWWEQKVEELVEDILQNPLRTIKSANDVREKLGQLFVSNIESEKVVTHMMRSFFRLKHPNSNVAQSAVVFAKFDCRLKNATRYVLHLEALLHALASIIHGSKDVLVSPLKHTINI